MVPMFQSMSEASDKIFPKRTCYMHPWLSIDFYDMQTSKSDMAGV